MSKNKVLKKPNTGLATQSNKLIQASYRMSVPAKRVMLMLLSHIHPGQKNVAMRITIHANDYADKTGLSFQQAYQDIKKGVRELQESVITTRDVDAKTTEKCVVVDWYKYHDDQGWLEATFTRWLAPYIHHLTKIGYTTIEVDQALTFRRFYTIRLYEIIMQFKSTGVRHITLVELRKLFQINQFQYPAFKDFRVKVLDPSVRELEEKTDWLVTYDTERTGRKVTHLIFMYEKQNQMSLGI